MGLYGIIWDYMGYVWIRNHSVSGMHIKMCSILLINLPGYHAYHAYHTCHAYPSDYLNRIQWIQSTLQIVPITYDIPMTISIYLGWFQIVYASIDLYTFPSASQKEWSSCPDHGRNHGRSTPQLPTGSFSDCSCSSSVVVILGSSAVPGLALQRIGGWPLWMPPTVHPTDILWAILWVHMTYPTDTWIFQFAKLGKNYRRVYPPDPFEDRNSMEVRNLQKDAGPSFPRFQLFNSYVLSILLLRVVLSIIQMRELPKLTWSSHCRGVVNVWWTCRKKPIK